MREPGTRGIDLLLEPLDDYVVIQPTDEDRTRAQRESLERVGAAAHTAVEQHLRAAVDRVDDFLQRVERAGHAVELAAAVVRDDDCGCAVLARELCVLSCENSLDDDRKAVAREPLEVVPAETRVEVPAEE